jgi:hypothetical protein
LEGYYCRDLIDGLREAATAKPASAIDWLYIVVSYDWHLDVETTFLAIAQRQPDFMSQSLNYFDRPIAETHHARVRGANQLSPPSRRSVGLTPEAIERAIAKARNHCSD